jgi:MATE family multidrug resistance protein
MTPLERKRSRHAEASLLRDNHVLPPKHARQGEGLATRLYRRIFGTKVAEEGRDGGPTVVVQPSETSPPLGDTPASEEDLEEQWEQAVASGRIKTTWQRETKTLVNYSGPLIVTFFLQYSINVASIFAVGRIGKIELGAVSRECPLPTFERTSI